VTVAGAGGTGVGGTGGGVDGVCAKALEAMVVRKSDAAIEGKTKRMEVP
jgi:hypothetical protein